MAPREVGLEYNMAEGGDVFYILTNADGAKDFKIVEAPFATPERAHWREVVAAYAGRLILSHMAFARHLVWLERENGLPQIKIRDRAAARSMRSPSRKRPIRSACRAPWNMTRMSSASPTPR